MTRFQAVVSGLALVGSVAAVLAVSSAVFGSSGRRASAEALARSVASEFFQTINERRYARTCDLLSAEFYRRNHVRDKKICALALTIGFTWSQEFRFRISGVSVDGDRAVVRAVADGAPGRIVLVREHGVFKVLAAENG